jgi:protein TonB
MNPRTIPSIGMGLLATLGLFLLMTTLVRGTQSGFEKPGGGELQDFVRARTEEVTREKEREMPKRPEPPKRPPTPTQTIQQQQVQQQTMDLDIPKIDVPLGTGGGGVFVPVSGAMGGGDAGGFGDGDLIPIVRIEPQFPREALIEGISGYVVLAFTVMEDGSVEPGSTKVVESKPPRLFDSAAMRAVARWKFKPRIVDGKPVKRPATQRLDFNLQQDEDAKR